MKNNYKKPGIKASTNVRDNLFYRCVQIFIGINQVSDLHSFREGFLGGFPVSFFVSLITFRALEPDGLAYCHPYRRQAVRLYIKGVIQ